LTLFVPALFEKCDENGDGELSAKELAVLVRDYYRHEKVGRSLSKVEKEVNEAMVEFDADSSGMLSFTEFVTMCCRSEAFRFKLRDEDKEAAMAAVYYSKLAESQCILIEAQCRVKDINRLDLEAFTQACRQTLGTAFASAQFADWSSTIGERSPGQVDVLLTAAARDTHQAAGLDGNDFGCGCGAVIVRNVKQVDSTTTVRCRTQAPGEESFDAFRFARSCAGLLPTGFCEVLIDAD